MQWCGLQCAADSVQEVPVEAAAAAASETAAGSEPAGLELGHGEVLELPRGIQLEPSVPVEQQRLVQVGVVGVPNAGKSTLVNALTRFKVSAVSPKTNTTQNSRLGAYTEGAAQVALYDTPGVVGKEHYKNPAQQQRVRSAWSVAADCDLLLFLVDAARQLALPDPRVHRLLASSSSAAAVGMPPGWQPPPALLVLNKVDAIPQPQRSRLLPLADMLHGLREFEDTFFISAKNGRGLPELRQFLLDRAEACEWVVDADMPTDRGEEEQAMEVVREQLFVRLYKEVPYQARLRVTSCLPRQDGSIHLAVEVLVANEGQKRIVIGGGGGVIAGISQAAAAELSRMWGHPVHLLLNVVVGKAV